MRSKIMRFAVLLLLILSVYLGILLAQGLIADWEPEEQITLSTQETKVLPAILTDSVISLGSWNVGFAGLGAESDFFFDNGSLFFAGSHMVYAPENLTKKNWAGIRNFIKNTPVDFWLVQEIDVKADRSHQIPEFAEIAADFPEKSACFAENYRAARVPIPIFEPWHFYGQVSSGIATYSKWQPKSSIRYQLPGKYGFPDQIFQLDRCAMLQRFPTKWGKELVVINLHNSAYDPADKLKKLQLPYLRDLAVSEFEKGNWVVLGGDWNQCPPYFPFAKFAPTLASEFEESVLPEDFFPENWQFLYDPLVPTNRKTRNPYKKGATFMTTIDYFLVSPNLKCRRVQTRDLDFEFSDHQPVLVELELLK